MSPIKTISEQTEARLSNTNNSTQGRTYGGLSQMERKLQRRQQFLQAGLNVFGTQGFRQATVRGLCKEARLTDRYFYAEFGNIENLLCAVYEDQMSGIHNQVMSAFAAAEPGANAEHLVNKALSAFYDALQDPRVARVCMVELEGVSPEVSQLYHSYIRRFADLMLTFINNLTPDWKYNEEEGAILTIAMIGAMRQAGTYWLHNPDTIKKETLIRVSTQLFMGVFNEVNNA